MIAKQTTAPLTVCVIASGLVPTALPAHATKGANGKHGWASAHYLRKVTK